MDIIIIIIFEKNIIASQTTWKVDKASIRVAKKGILIVISHKTDRSDDGYRINHANEHQTQHAQRRP